MARVESIATPSRDDFAAMLEASFVERAPAEGSVVRGMIVGVENDFVVVDVGLKTEGRVPLKEFSRARHAAERQGRRRGRGLSRAGRECSR